MVRHREAAEQCSDAHPNQTTLKAALDGRAEEQLFRKQQVVGSSPTTGSRR